MNEDLGAASKRKCALIRLISKQAQEQGIDCKTGKYSLHVQNVKYDATNFENLPPQEGGRAEMKTQQIRTNWSWQLTLH